MRGKNLLTISLLALFISVPLLLSRVGTATATEDNTATNQESPKPYGEDILNSIGEEQENTSSMFGKDILPPKQKEVSDCDLLAYVKGDAAECAFINIFTVASRFFSNFASYGISLTKSFINASVITNTNDTALKGIWMMVRNFTNALFGAALIIIAFANMLRINMRDYDIKILLPRFFITIIMVNFSWVIANFVVDFANVVTESLININKDIGTHNIEGAFSLSEGLNDLTGTVLNLLLVFILFIAGFIVSLYVTILMAIRVVVLWILIAASPIAFGMGLLPFTKKLESQWWSTFTSWVFMGAVVEFVLSVGERLMYSYSETHGPFWVKPVLAIALLVAAATAPQSLGGKLMSSFTKPMNKALGKGREMAFNKAWTGKGDGKGTFGLRNKLGFWRRGLRQQYIDDMHEANVSSQEKQKVWAAANAGTLNSREDRLNQWRPDKRELSKKEMYKEIGGKANVDRDSVWRRDQAGWTVSEVDELVLQEKLSDGTSVDEFLYKSFNEQKAKGQPFNRKSWPSYLSKLYADKKITDEDMKKLEKGRIGLATLTNKMERRPPTIHYEREDSTEIVDKNTKVKKWVEGWGAYKLDEQGRRIVHHIDGENAPAVRVLGKYYKAGLNTDLEQSPKRAIRGHENFPSQDQIKLMLDANSSASTLTSNEEGSKGEWSPPGS